MRRAAFGALLSLAAAVAVAEELRVGIVSPAPGAPIFGRTVLEAGIYPTDAAIEAIEFFVDFQRVGRVTEPPWRVEVDVGQENRARRIEVVAHRPGGGSVSARLETDAIDAQEEIDVRLQQLFVTVSRGRDRVLDLGRDDFTIRDGGRRQEIMTFERGDVPFSAVVLVDASGSMAGQRLRTALEGARAFAEQVQPLDRVKLLVFSDRRLRETPFTNLAQLVLLGAEERPAGGGTALNDMLYLALKRLERQQGRRVVLLLSDGVDVDSIVEVPDLAQVARRLGVLIYWVRLPSGDGDKYTAWRGPREHRQAFRGLASTVRQSGGREVAIASPEEVEAAFVEILRELRRQYVLGYQPEPRGASGTWRTVRVGVAAPGVSVRAPRGYVVP